MKTVELVDYISNALQEGKSFRSITFELINAGWDNGDIKEAIEQIQHARTLESQHIHTIEKEKPFVRILTPSSNPLPALVQEGRSLSLQKKRTQGAIPASRIFTSFLKKEIEKQPVVLDNQPTLSDVPLVEIMSPTPSKPKEESLSKQEKPTQNTISEKSSELSPPLPPHDQYEAGIVRPEGYFIPTLRYLADEAVLGKQDVQTVAEQIGRPTFVVPTKVLITLWRRDDGSILQK